MQLADFVKVHVLIFTNPKVHSIWWKKYDLRTFHSAREWKISIIYRFNNIFISHCKQRPNIPSHKILALVDSCCYCNTLSYLETVWRRREENKTEGKICMVLTEAVSHLNPSVVLPDDIRGIPHQINCTIKITKW